MHTVFDELIAPLRNFFRDKSSEFDEQAGSEALFFKDFTLKLIFAHVMKFSSLKVLITELKSNEAAEKLGFQPTPYSTFRDGFSRFESDFFHQAFQFILQNSSWLSIPAIDELGIFKLVDGSIFPNISSMDWAVYKNTKNAIRLHLSFDLNRMIPTEFIATAANFSERNFLQSIVQQGITYIADRGYFSFDLANHIATSEAFFIFRVKGNYLFSVCQNLAITSLSGMPACFVNVKDQMITFDNDDYDQTYRMVCFTVLSSDFIICTNRTDLSTLEIIMLYAYRWQVELLFKFIKRTLNGIHLFNLSPNGVTIHFYVLLITAVLELRLKQLCINFVQFTETIEPSDVINVQKLELFSTYKGFDPAIWIKNLTDKFYKYWKIGLHWLIILKNSITKPFDFHIITKLGGT